MKVLKWYTQRLKKSDTQESAKFEKKEVLKANRGSGFEKIKSIHDILSHIYTWIDVKGKKYTDPAGSFKKKKKTSRATLDL